MDSLETSDALRGNQGWTLVEGHLYRIRSRNLPYGVYDGDSGFIGIREKFGSLYLFTEYDWDDGSPHGTVTVKEDLGPVPEDIELIEGRWAGEEPEWIANTALYDFLARAEEEHGHVPGFGRRPGGRDD